MPRPWRGTRGSLLILTAKVNAPKSWIIIIRAKTYELYVSTFSTGNAAIVSWILWVTFIWSGVNMDLVSSSVTFLPENVFLLLQSVVVSFIIHMLVQFTGFLDPSCLIQEKWIPLHGLHMTVINVLEFVFFWQWNSFFFFICKVVSVHMLLSVS